MTPESLSESVNHPDELMTEALHEDADLSGVGISDTLVPTPPRTVLAYSATQATIVLRNLGFQVRGTGEFAQALSTFQSGYNLGAWLRADGRLGLLTSAALTRSETNRKAGRGTASAHFSFSEWRCGCGGRYVGCRTVLVRRELLQSLEKYRAKAGPTKIMSGYRCPQHNRAVGGASNSQHMYGTAVDLSYQLSSASVRSLRAFSGIGRSRRTHLVRHVDRRDISGHNNGGSLALPMIWDYSS